MYCVVAAEKIDCEFKESISFCFLYFNHRMLSNKLKHVPVDQISTKAFCLSKNQTTSLLKMTFYED